MDQSIERWLPVVGYEGIYEVSDLGNVRSLDRYDSVGAFRSGQEKHPRTDQDGYKRVSLSSMSKKRSFYVHCLVLEAFVGPRPSSEHEACHNNGAPDDNRLTNLRWDTGSANCVDMVNMRTHRQTRKTHCPRGHLLAAPNLSKTHLAKGQRDCLACAKGRQYARYHRIDFTKEIADMYYERVTRQPATPRSDDSTS